MKSLWHVTLASAALVLPSLAATAQADWMSRVGDALGKTGSEMPGGVYRVGLPRTDLKVTLDGVELKAGFALGSWLAFQKMGDDAMVMGDLVLTSEEVNPVMKKLEEGGIEITALHNHLLRNQPFTMYMHVLGRGDPVKLAATLHGALVMSKTPLPGAPAAVAQPSPPPPIDFDTAAVDKTLGAKGKNNGGVYQFSIPRAEPIKDGGMEVPEAMGSAIAINFQPTGGGKAAITGDFVLVAKEVNPVLKALRDNGIEVTAVHNHMLDDQPRLFFMHFWANDDAQQLANGLKAALAKVNIAKS
jgi:biotin operon repressor